MLKSFFYLPVLLLLASTPLMRAQVHEGRELVRANLIANVDAVTPGKPFLVGVLLEMAPKWHTYWEYPGDAGLATSIAWSLPEGYEAGPIQWPLPRQYTEPGDLVVFAYGGQTLLMTEITPPREIPAGTEVVLRAHVEWLVCEEICVPGNANVELALPIAENPQPANEEIFDAYRAKLPSLAPPAFPVEIRPLDPPAKGYALEVNNLPPGAKAEFFPLPPADASMGHVQSEGLGDSRKLTIPWPEGAPLKGVLSVTNAQGLAQGWQIDESVASTMAVPPAVAILDLWTALLYGFIGGLILNVMPCVLPVISLKIFGFIRQAGDDRRRIFKHGLAFVSGIFLFFLALGVLVAVLKTAGHQVTWAFQFQSPYFNLVMSVIVLVFSLNLFGVFEFTLPGKAGQTMDELGRAEGYSGSFFQGIFATLLATPCTAPFLAPALGFAFSQPPAIILATFGAVALGMSSPYFLLSAQPGWMRWLPKPGAWMEKVKQLMGFALLATLVWLLYILGVQTGVDGVVMTLAFLVCVGLACWIYGAFGSRYARAASRVPAVIAMVIVILGGGWIFLGKGFAASQAMVPAESGGIAWTPFTPASLEKFLAEGRGVFLDFTAAWCLSCKFNERTAIDRPAVREALAASGLVAMKADWTNADPDITAELNKFGRVGVPFYVIYPPGNKGTPIILPELLTEQIVLDGIQEAINADTTKKQTP